MNENIKSKLLLIAIGVVALLTIVFWLRSGDEGPVPAAPRPPDRAFFTIDDGANYFAAPRQIPPFDYQGKQAVQAFVFELGGKKSVAYMMRATPAAKRQAGTSDAKSTEAMLGMQPANWEVKRPGDATWISMADSRAVQMMSPPAPSGSSQIPTLVEPE